VPPARRRADESRDERAARRRHVRPDMFASRTAHLNTEGTVLEYSSDSLGSKASDVHGYRRPALTGTSSGSDIERLADAIAEAVLQKLAVAEVPPPDEIEI
jgi:hypothetical protein